MNRCLHSLLGIALCAALVGSPASAQQLPGYFTTNNNAGTDYYFSFLPAWPTPGGVNNIRIYVSSAVETAVTVEVASDGFVQTQMTKPNDVIEFILPVSVAQPYFKTDREPSPDDAVYRQKAVHVFADDPIVVYGMTRYQYTSDGFLALPVSALGTDYVIASYADVGDNGGPVGQFLPSEAAIVAPFDGTVVTFTLGGTPATQTSGGQLSGETRVVELNRGDVFAVASFGHGADLSGSRVVSNKPVSIVSGNFCAYVPIQTAACDHLIDMELPSYAWGTAYVVPQIFGRQKNAIIKIMAKEPNTTVYRDDVEIGVIQQAGGVEGVGYLHLRVDEGMPGTALITADKPISVTQFNAGQQDDGVPSDPFQLVLTPVGLYSNEVLFNTPGVTNDETPSFERNYVNLVFELSDEGTMPDDLMFGWVENGVMQWTNLDMRFGAMFEALGQAIDGKWYGVKTILLPFDGVFGLRSSRRIAAYSYGFSAYDSYGYPAGALLADGTGGIDNKPPVPIFTLAGNGSVGDGMVSDQQPSGWVSKLAKVSMLNAFSENYTFSHGGFLPGIDEQTTWALDIIDDSKPARAVLLFVDRAGNDTTVVIEHGVVSSVGETALHGKPFLTPQPAVDNTVLHFALLTGTHVRIEVYNELGEKTAVIADGMRSAGAHSIDIRTAALPAGVYLYRLTAGGQVSTGRFVVVR